MDWPETMHSSLAASSASTQLTRQLDRINGCLTVSYFLCRRPSLCLPSAATRTPVRSPLLAVQLCHQQQERNYVDDKVFDLSMHVCGEVKLVTSYVADVDSFHACYLSPRNPDQLASLCVSHSCSLRRQIDAPEPAD